MTDHDMSLLGPYVLGALEPAEVREVEEHLAGCVDCRKELAELEEMKQFLGEAPPEAFLDGPPTDGDLLLQRTLRAARASTGSGTGATGRPRWKMAAASAAVIGAVALSGTGGVLVGRGSVDQPTPPAPTTVAGSRHATATDATTAAAMKTTVEPRAGWSWVNVRVTGLTAGAECELVVTDVNGKTYVAGSWVVSDKTAREGSPFSGGVQVPIDQVASVQVRTAVGEHVVTTEL